MDKVFLFLMAGKRDARGISRWQTTPEGSKERWASPLSSPTKACSISRVPKLWCVGIWTDGPPASTQENPNRSFEALIAADIATQPAAFDSAPYLTALVQSSLRIIARGRTAEGLTSISGISTEKTRAFIEWIDCGAHNRRQRCA